MKNLFTIILCVYASVAWAKPAEIIVKGSSAKAYVYNGERGEGRRMFEDKTTLEEQKILIPEEQCSDLLYLIVGDMTSWIRVLPGETIQATVSEQGFAFMGDEADINNYLFDWTRKLYFGKSNALCYEIQVMMWVIPQSKKGMPDVKEFYTPEYMQWVAGLKETMEKELKKAGLKDREFVQEQQQRIKYAWWELQFANYRIAKNVGEIPAEAMKFMEDVKLNDPAIMKYPGFHLIQRECLDMAERCGLLKYDRYAGYLRARADYLKVPALQEKYILDELFLIFQMRGYTYQGDLLLNSVEDLIVSAEGKQRLRECRKLYEELMTTDMNGKEAVDFNFENYQGGTLGLEQFRGKFLFIDIWATWCAPCRAQIPYLKKLEKIVEGLPIQFLSISVDNQEKKAFWKELVKKFELQEEYCAIAPDTFRHPVFEKYKVDGIPHFVLIDPEGKVVMSSARLPSDPLLLVQLKELMH